MSKPRNQAPQATPAAGLPGRVARETLPAVVVLAGAEAWFRRRGVEHLVARMLPEGDPGGAVVHLDARIPDQRERVAGALEELRSASLFAAGKVVVVENPEAAPALPGAGRAATLTYLAKQALEHPVGGTLLVLSTAKPVKGREAVSTKALLTAGAWVVDCRALYDAPAPWERGTAPHDHELSRFVATRMRQVHGKTLALEAAHALTRRVGSDLFHLEDALQSLALYVGAGDRVDLDTVERTVGQTREDPIWRLVDAVLDGAAERALDLVEAAFERGLSDARGVVSARPEALFPQLAAALHASFRRVLAGAEALRRGEEGDAVARAQGIAPFLARTFLARCRRDPDQLLELHRLFLQAEIGVKGGGVPPRLAGERLVAGLVGGLRGAGVGPHA